MGRIEKDITPLRVWSGYSLLRGAAHVERLVARAAELGHTSLALTDVNGLYGAPVFHRLACEAGILPLIGTELPLNGERLVALVADDAGYENLCRILTRIHDEEIPNPKAQTPDPGSQIPDLRSEISDGLHSDVSGTFAGLFLIAEGPETAQRLATSPAGRIAADENRLYVGVDPATQPSTRIRALLETGLAPVATGTALFLNDRDRETARLLAAIRTGSTFDAVADDELPHPGAALRSGAELAAGLADLPRAVRNNHEIAERCAAFRLLPRGPVFPDYPCPDSLTPAAYLRRLCESGVGERYGRWPPAGFRARLDRELSLIEAKGFSGYFLVVWDIVRHARKLGAPVAGRGSGGSSLVAYLLGITNVCPLACNIPFERFLNKQRDDFPDLDIDFCWRIRDDVIDYAFRRWGEDHAAMVCTHNTFRGASAFRETAKAFGMSNDQISRLDEADLGESAGDGAGEFLEIVRLGRRLLGLPHHLSVHPGGIVLGPKGIDRHSPIERAAKGVPITQYDKNGVEDVGLIKLDLLGNRSLSTLAAACRLVSERTGEQIDPERLPPTDPGTVATLQTADTVGCNQLESPAMRHLLRALRPERARDLMQTLALIRPGAASIGMKETFIRRRRGLEPVPRWHPKVDPILADSVGVMVYEDDVMLVAAAMMGTSPATADRFRKAIQKCHSDDARLRLSREFLSCCRDDIDPSYAKSMWVQMAKFNAYSFCRAHAGSYAVLAYALAYLKTHHPIEFWAAALNNNQSMYPPRVYVEQAKRSGVSFLRPDVNRSQEEFCVEGESIRVGLNFIAGLGPVGAATVLDARRRDGKFAGLADFVARTNLAAEQVRALILCGAFDALGRTRPVLMMELNMLSTLPSQRRPAGQRRLVAAGAPVFPNPPGDYDESRKYWDERRILGISTREHIMARYRRIANQECHPDGHRDFASRGNATSRELPELIGRRACLAGVLEARRTVETRNGRTMAFLTFDDEFGLFEATVFPDACRGVRLDRYGPYLVEGQVEEQFDTVTLAAERITLPTARRQRAAS